MNVLRKIFKQNDRMKQNTKLLKVLMGIGLVGLVACKPAQVFQGQGTNAVKAAETIDICNQTIKYYADNIKLVSAGKEEAVSANTEITINPSAKIISIMSEPPNQDKVSFNTVIENFDCTLNADLTDGQTIYTGYIVQTDGSSTKAIIKVEAKDGVVTISNGDTERATKMLIVVSKWEIVKEN